MARESKATRDERRFGRSDLLIDRILGGQPKGWSAPPNVDVSLFADACRPAKHIEASNVVAYNDSQKDNVMSWLELPSCRLPFDNIFIEGQFFGKFTIRGGMLLRSADAKQVLSEIRIQASDPENNFSSIWDDLPRLESQAFQAIEFGVIMGGPRGNLMGPLFQGAAILDERGCLMRAPFGLVAPGLELIIPDPNEIARSAKAVMYPLLLAIAFMNCKNVSLNSVEPDRQINRERRKAGLKPFVRYHTINIEPMKRVLKTEGNVESEGLKRALHICRGHFSTYSEEKPLFGKVAGTFWIPAHVRGSAKEGVVISDYNVKGPTK